jgi:dolichol kinase
LENAFEMPVILQNSQRLKLLMITLIATAAISGLLKIIIDMPRPCQIDPTAYAYCLPDRTYPSQHTAVSFSFVYPFLGHVLFPILYGIGLLVGWSRVYEGQHFWLDIGGGIAVAGLGYMIAETVVIRQKNIVLDGDERARQLVHASVGLILCAVIWFVGLEFASYLVLVGTCLGILIVHLVLVGIKFNAIDKLLDKLERRGALPGEGSMYYALGILFALGLLRENAAAAVSVILILAIGDSLSTHLGMNYGKNKLPWNSSKTFEGSVAFAAGSMVAFLILPVNVTLFVILAATLVESFPQLDDNITVPFVCSIVYYLLL